MEGDRGGGRCSLALAVAAVGDDCATVAAAAVAVEGTVADAGRRCTHAPGICEITNDKHHIN